MVATGFESTTLTFRELDLPDRWSAQVLAGGDGPALRGQFASGIPAVEQWRGFLTSLISDPDSLPDCQWLKVSDSGSVIQTCVGDQAVVCKQRLVKGWRRSFVQPFRHTVEERDFIRARDLLSAGIATAVPCALATRSSPRRSWIISSYVPDLIDLDNIAMSALPAMDRSRQLAKKNQLIKVVADLVVRLARAGYHHRDFKASNILIAGFDTPEPKPYIVDLEGLRRGRKDRMAPIVRLAASLVEYDSITTTDYCRFLRTYMNSSKSRGLKDTWRTIESRARKYNLAASQRKAAKTTQRIDV